MPGKAKKRGVLGLYMSILSPFPTPHGAAGGFFNSLLGPVNTNPIGPNKKYGKR
jgi:hypothetical protein